MEKYNKNRWERIQDSNLEYEYIKKHIKLNMNINLNESSLEEFIQNIDKYKIDQFKLLNEIEEYSYQRLIIYNMKDLKRFKIHPIIKNLTTNYKMYFKQQNRININPKEFYKGDLDSIYKVIYYDDTDTDLFEIRMAAIKNYSYTIRNKNGNVGNFNKDIFDSIKIVINFKKSLVTILYSDIKESKNKEEDISHRKADFSNLFFGEVTKGNLQKISISSELTKYVSEYIAEELTLSNSKNTNRKLVETIEVDKIKKDSSGKSITKSSESTYIHSKDTLKGINDKIKSGSYKVIVLETTIKDNRIKFKHDGEVILSNTTFQSEVIEDVCTEVLDGYNPFK